VQLSGHRSDRLHLEAGAGVERQGGEIGSGDDADDGLWNDARACLGEHLLVHDMAPLAVAFSGGGDSLALLLAAKSWCDRHGRRLLALTVDHRLQSESANWARWCRQRADQLGVAHQILVWDGPKPPSGLSAAARWARHALLANAAREAGAAVILMGHTADDRAEAALMREEGSTTPSPRTWTPSPVWPEGRGVFILRPLLRLRRDQLRDALVAAGETWIEDPANDNPASARARARIELAGRPPGDMRMAATKAADLADFVEGPAGDLSLPRQSLIDSPRACANLAAALLCAAGTDRPPRGERLRRLLDRILAGETFVATLAGAKVHCVGERIHIVRDTADRRGGDFADLDLPPDRGVVWDGRFELRASVGGARVGHLAGRATRLPPDLHRAVLASPAAARPALPLVTHADGRLECPSLRASATVAFQALASSRLFAARGAIVSEATLRRMAKPRHLS
jgi:tRNA(Ile)-lysidine synthase